MNLTCKISNMPKIMTCKMQLPCKFSKPAKTHLTFKPTKIDTNTNTILGVFMEYKACHNKYGLEHETKMQCSLQIASLLKKQPSPNNNQEF